MRDTRLESKDTIERKPASEPEIDYSPKTYTLMEQIVFGAKMIAVAGIIVLLLWVSQKYLVQ